MIARLTRRARELAGRHRFGSYGSGFRYDPGGIYSYANIHVGDDVDLGRQPVMLAARSRILIGSHVMFGPRVMLIAGNHNTRPVGRWMKAVVHKEPEDDRDIVIRDDVWLGAGVTVLLGVEIGRGAIVGAGSLVKNDVPAYCIVVGNPARVVRMRWAVEDILRHEQSLYPPDHRLSRETLEEIRNSAGVR